jgi:putative FmdB family regulatory protein
MPVYEFICKKCKKRFSVTMPVAEYEKRRFKCPKCKSNQVRQQISTVQTITSKKG